MRYRVLGPLRITDGDRDLTPSGDRQRRLLAALVLERGAVVSADRLAELLWPDRLPADQASALQTHVFRLRRVLPEGAIETVGAGYRLAAPADDIDADRFAELVTDAIAEGSSDPRRGASCCSTKRFPSGAGNPTKSWRRPTQGASRRRASASWRWPRASSGSSPSQLSVGTVTRATAWPSSSRSLPSIRFASGPASCSWLRSMNVAAAPKHLGRMTTSGDGSPTSWGSLRRPSCRRCTTRSCPERRARASASERRAASSVPLAPNVLVGRDDLVATIVERIASVRLVTLIGPGGVGKTRVAGEAARRFESSGAPVWFC